jgi:hypothetical protein
MASTRRQHVRGKEVLRLLRLPQSAIEEAAGSRRYAGRMTKVLRVNDRGTALVTPSTMLSEGLGEVAHLEQWLVQHIDAIDPALKVVTTQFNRWASSSTTAAERLDILALAQSGELVVIELKRGLDKNIHLQAISYGALVSGFTIESLGRVHADWVNKSRGVGALISVDEADSSLRAHVDDDGWTDEVLQQTRLVLVAEEFPALVLTTVQWLAIRAPELRIECHQYTVFRDDAGLMVAFDRLYPVNDLSDMVLSPSSPTSSAAARVAKTQRQAKSVVRIHQTRAIPEGAKLTLELSTHTRPEFVQKIDAWLDADPLRKDFTWVDDPDRPLRWGADPSTPSWTPSALRNRIFVDAGLVSPSFSAADAWTYLGKSLYEVANDSGAAGTPTSVSATQVHLPN